MKREERCLAIGLLCFFSLLLYGTPISQTPSLVVPRVAPAEEPVVPPDFEASLKGGGKNWLEVRVNQSIARSIRERKVSLEALNEYLFLLTIPNFAYRGDEGEERLGNDIMNLLGTIQTPSQTVMMELQWSELVAMGLPFKKKITDALLFPATYFERDIDFTFFVDMNALTARVGAAFESKPDMKPVYNSSQRFYRVRQGDLSCIFIVNIANVAYEIAYTGEPFENVMKRYVAEAEFLFTVMGQYEKKIKKDKNLEYDGRYIKGKDIFVDLWFLYSAANGNVASAKQLMEKVLQHKPVSVSGSEKKGEQ